jgi:prepilin-type N-terminal cleavage/methylation domain-containing protein
MLPSRTAVPRLSSQDGFTLIELLVALMVLTVGIFAVATTFEFSRASTNQSELKTSAIDRAQREIEAVRSLPYDQIAHPAGGIVGAAGDETDPTSRISGGNFAWNRAQPSSSEPLVTGASGTVPMLQTIEKGDDDRFGYTIWRFVTATQEPACAAAVDCEEGSDGYRRVTIVVRASGLGDTLDPVWTSTTVIDPSLAANNEGQPETLCQNSEGTALELCSVETDGEQLDFYLTNTRANSGDVRLPVPADPAQRTLHKTVKVPATCTAVPVSNSGCPIPDLMVAEPLAWLDAGDPATPPLVSFGTDVVPSIAAGRPLLRDVACDATPSKTDDLKGAYWVTPPLANGEEVTGTGVLRLYGHAWSAAAHDVTLCGVVYEVPGAIVNPVSNPPVEIGRIAAPYGWPAEVQPLSFDVDLGLADSDAVPAGKRIGLRLWVAGSSSDDVVVIYDHPNHQSSLSLMVADEEE